jgi:hypothetical protein
MALEVSVWEDLSGSGGNARLLGETVIPLESAITHHSEWWPLLPVVNRSLQQTCSSGPASASLPVTLIEPVDRSASMEYLSMIRSRSTFFFAFLKNI